MNLFILSAIVQVERQRILERNNKGRLEAKGVKFGRKTSIDREKILALRNEGLGATEFEGWMEIHQNKLSTLLS